MPNFDDGNEKIDDPSSPCDVSATREDTDKSTPCEPNIETKSEIVNDENSLDKVTTEETKDDSKRNEKNSLHRDVSVDALSSEYNSDAVRNAEKNYFRS